MSSKLIRFYNFHFLLPRNFGNNDIIVNRVRFQRALYSSLRKQPTFSDATTGFPAKWRLRNERRNSILMTRYYPDLGSASDWLNQIPHAARPIRSTTQIWVVTCRQNGISALVSKTLYGGETSGSVAKSQLFSQANFILNFLLYEMWKCLKGYIISTHSWMAVWLHISVTLFICPSRINVTISFSTDYLKLLLWSRENRKKNLQESQENWLHCHHK